MERNLIEYSQKASEKRIRKEILLCAVILILSITAAYVFLGGPRLLGFFAAGEQKVFSDTINKEFNESQDYIWNLGNFQENSQLLSVKVSGAIQGKGKIYLVTDSGKLLIFDSSSLKTGLSPLTAFAAASETAQPGPPSSGDSSSPEESPSEETDTTSGPGAESPPPASAPEVPPAGNETPPAPENITQPENVTAPENVTGNQTQENITLPENATNQTIEIPLAVEIPFETACEETCYISEMLNNSNYTLQIEVEPGTILKLGSITYELLIPQIENITNETVFFATGIEDSNNNTIAATVEFVDPSTEEVEAIGKSEEGEKSVEETFGMPIFQGAAVVEEPTGEAGLDIPKGKYDIKVKPQNHPVKEIVFGDVDISQNITEFIKLDDVPEEDSGYAEIYAIDPTAFEFTEATVTAIAKGTVLYKCKNWDFAAQKCPETCSEAYDEETGTTYQSCREDWAFLQAITPGEQYTFTLTPEDPGYAEYNSTFGAPECTTSDSPCYSNQTLICAGDQPSPGPEPNQPNTIDTCVDTTGETEACQNSQAIWNITVKEATVSDNKLNPGEAVSVTFYAWCDNSNDYFGMYYTNSTSSIVWQTALASNDPNCVASSWYTRTVNFTLNNVTGKHAFRVVQKYSTTASSCPTGATTNDQDVDDLVFYVAPTNNPPTTPTNITCNGGSCNNTFYTNVTLQCSGSTDAENDTITYVIDAYYNQSTTSETTVQVPSSCSDSTFASGAYEFYSHWTIPGSGTATITKLWFWQADTSLSGSETLELALYNSSGNQISEEVTITGTGASGWISGTLVTPISITLGQTYYVGVAPISATYNLGRDEGANCANYPPTGSSYYSYYVSSSNNDLDSTVPTGSQSGSAKYILPGITYTTGSYSYLWTTIGNHTNGSTYLWNLSGIAEQSNVNLRCNATDLAGSNTYSNYSTGTYNLTITGTPPPDTTPPASVTNLNETSTGQTWIYWAWTNPSDPDFDKAIIYIDGSNILNTSNAYYNATGFNCSTTHNITIHTKDTTGNVNTTNVIDSATTSACPDTQAPQYSNDADNSSGSVYDNKTVAVSVYWQDNYQLSTAIFRTNQSGSWANISTCALSGAASWCNQTINAASYAGKTICWNQYANDTTGNLNATMSQTAHCFNVASSDLTPPAVTPNNPANNSVDGDGSVLFNCSATDNNALASISLYINSILNQTNTVTGTSNSTTFSKTLANSNYNWYCRASDVAGNANDSATYALTVNTAAVPISTLYSGNTTSWAALPDLTNVCNGQAILEIPSYGQIQWYGCVNVASQNFDTNVNISNNFIAVNFGLNPTFNSSAHVIMRGLTWDSTPEILMDGVLCDSSVCQNITYDDVSTLEFDVTHFTNFSTVGNARLVIWDQNDTGMPGDNLSACLSSQIKFFANYTRSLNGNPITGATCIINFTDTTNNAMTYNATSTFYEYNRTFSTTGPKTYVISCVKTTLPTRQRITLSDSVNITDCAPPQWSSNQSSYPAKYNASQLSSFNITWADNANVSAVLIEGNWSGSPTNYSMNLISGTTANGVWNYSTGPLAAGTYYWKSYANDTSNSWNATSTWTFTIAKADNPTDLYLNGNKNQNVTITYPTSSNATGVALVGTANLFRDGSPVGNPEIANLSANTAGYNYTVTTAGNANYSANSTTYFLIINPTASQVQLLLDGTAANKTVEVGSTVNSTVIMITPSSGSVELWRNGSLVQSGSAPLTNISTFNILGAYNMTAVYPATTNYTTSTDTHYVITQDTTPPNVYLTSPGNNTAIKIQTQGFTFNATDNYYTTLSCTLYINNIPSGTNASVAVNTATTITNTTIPEGNNLWYVNCTDSSSNTGKSENRILTVDLTPPVITHIRPVQNDILGYTVTLEVNATDNLVGVNSVWYQITNTSGIVKSGTMSDTAPIYTDIWNSTTVNEGNYTFTAYANDTLGNQGNSSVNFTIDNTPPLIQIFTPLNGSPWNSNFNLNVNIQNSLLAASSYNITNSTGYVLQSNSNNSINKPVFNWTDLVNVTNLPSGTYNLTVYARNNVGYPATESVVFIVDKAPPQYSNLVASPASPAIYSPTQAYQFNATWIDNVGMGAVIFEFNGTNYTDAVSVGSIFSKNFTGLPFGTYNYKWYANDTAGNWNSTGTFTYIINKAPTTTSLYLNGAQANATITYGAQSNATAVTSAGSVTLYRNGTGVGTQEIATLGAGVYNYTAINTGDSNYLPSSETWWLTINKATPTLNLLLDGAAADKTVTYPTQTNATGYETNTGDSDVTYTLFRNANTIGSGSSVSDVQTLGANTYVYTYNTSGGTNYTSNTLNKTLTVNIRPTAVDLFLNGTQNNLTVTYGTQTNVTAIGYNGTVTLYRNGTNVGTQEIATLPVGYYNYTAAIPDDVNHTGSSKTFFLAVNIAQTYVNLSLNGVENNITITYPQTITAVFSTNLLSATMYRNGTNINAENNTAVTLAAGYYNYTVANPGDANHTGSSKTFFVTVNKQLTAVDLFLNGAQSNLNITYGTQSNATAVGYNGTVALYRNGTPVGNPEITILPYGLYNYTAVIPDDANRTGSAKTFFLAVNKVAANITLLLNGTNNDFNVNRSQTVNITGIRNAGEGSLQLYDNSVLINSGAPVITNTTSYATLGQRNITLYLPETQNYSAATSTHVLSVYGVLSAYVTAPIGTPKYYEGQNITFKGYVRDDLANPVDGATVTFEPINGSYVYVCSSTLGEGSGIYNCTLDTTGMASPKTYNVRINATKTNYYTATYTNSSVFFLESGQKANLLLHKIPSVQAINSSHITYNVTLQLANGRGTSDNTTLKDADANQTWNEGSIYGAQEIIESYLLTYARGAADNTITLQKANVTGYDPFYNTSLFAESNQPTIVIPQNITGAQLTLIKNIVFVNQTTTNITYTIVDTVVNSGGQDLTGIAIVDSDISLTTTANLTRGNSATYSGNKTIAKNSQSYTFNFTQTSAFANSQFFYSNSPSIVIPGYGGPYDVIIDSLPASVTAGSTITGVVKAINMNSEISEDRTLTTWIEDQFGNITALDVRTIFIGRNQSATATITLTAPSTPGTYHFVSELAWPTATANASKAFDVISAAPPIPPAPAPGPAVAPPVNITLPPGVPQDIINSLIELRNIHKELAIKTENLNNIIKAAEDAAARRNYDLARNLINSAYGMISEIQREICGKTNITLPKFGITLPTVQFTWPKLPEINIAKFFGAKWLIWILLAAATAIFIIAFIVWRNEEMALEAELLREERTHLEKLYDKVSNYLNRKKKQGDKKNEV